MTKHLRLLLTLTGFLLLTASFFVASSSSTAQGTTNVALTSTEVGVGETSTMAARITCGASTCSGFSVTLAFDQELVRVQNIDVGPALGSDVFVATETIDNAAGTVTLSATAVQTPPEGADNVLFEVQLGGLTAGEASVEVSDLRIAGPDGNTLPSTGQGTTVSVVETGNIPFFSPPTPDWEIAFVSDRDGNPEIYVINADGTGLRRLTRNTEPDDDPTWSPSGDRLAFHAVRNGAQNVYVMAPDGSNQQPLTTGTAADYRPTWSPDGAQIAFVSERDGNPEIYVMNADGTNQRRLTNNGAADTEPAWSPGGQRVLFTSDRDGVFSLYAVDASTGTVQAMSDLLGANGSYPYWHPDGSRIALTISREGPANVYTMTPDGQNSLRITEEGDGLAAPAWSPDGNFLAFKSNRFGADDLFVEDVANDTLYRLTDNEFNDYEPDWRAVGEPEPCVISTDQPEIGVRVGPGINRAIFTYMPRNTALDVNGQFTDEEGARWFRMDKAEFEGTGVVNSLWVRVRDINTAGDCNVVPPVNPPPLIPGEPGQPGDGGDPGDGWGQCGSCDTCGHPSGECVTSPSGECLWDPETCGDFPPPPTPQNGDEDGCYFVSTRVLPEPAYGSVAVEGELPCGEQGGYEPGSFVSLQAIPNQGYYFMNWDDESTTCPISGSDPIVNFVINSNCTAVANFGIQ